MGSDGRGITVDAQAISPPFVFQAIGDPTTMSTALNRRGGVIELLKGTYPGLELSVKPEQRVLLPARRDGKEMALAKPAK